MSTLTERVARAIEDAANLEPADPSAPAWMNWTAEAEAAIREVLAAMLDPSEARAAARLAMWRDTRARPSASDWLAAVVDADLRAFAREHGLAPPPAPEQQP